MRRSDFGQILHDKGAQQIVTNDDTTWEGWGGHEIFILRRI